MPTLGRTFLVIILIAHRSLAMPISLYKVLVFVFCFCVKVERLLYYLNSFCVCFGGALQTRIGAVGALHRTVKQ